MLDEGRRPQNPLWLFLASYATLALRSGLRGALYEFVGFALGALGRSICVGVSMRQADFIEPQ